jgi:hypothetical protein
VYVRIARFEGGNPADADQTIAGVRQMIQSDSPEGLEGAKRFLMLVDRKEGRGLGVTFYDSEEDMRRGDEALNAMTPPQDAGGRRTSVEMYEVAIDEQL